MTLCVYCGEQEGNTVDHVPPKSFFAKPRPSNLITVPSCEACNQGASMDEDYFVATCMFSDAGVTMAGTALWKQRLRRMYDKNLGLRKRIARSITWRNVVTPVGIFLGRRLILEYDEARMDFVVRKIIRGLYYYEYSEALPNITEVTVLFLNTEEKFNTMQRYAQYIDLGQRYWPGVFEYQCNRNSNDATKSMWLIRFYGTLCYWGVTRPDESQEAGQDAE